LLPPVERHTCHALSVIYRAGQVPSVSQSLTAPRMLLALAAGVTLLLIGSAQALGQPSLSTPATPDVVETSSIQISGNAIIFSSSGVPLTVIAPVSPGPALR